MALQYLRPTSTQNDLTLNLFVPTAATDDVTMPRFRTLAPEWTTQSGVQLTWPHAGTDWAYMLDEVTECYLRIAFEIATRETLLIVTPHPAEVKSLLESRLPQRATRHIIYKECATNDTWARDHGPLTVVGSDGWELLDFRFNGWGGKFAAEKDNAINAQLGDVLRGKYVDCLDFELEGGGIETDGEGTLLSTVECLLNPNRRGPHPDLGQVEALLGERLGVDHFLWLHHGYLAGDDTDSHIDTLARLCPQHTIVYVQCTDPADEHFAELKAMEEELQDFRTKEGEPYRLIAVPLPEAVHDADGERLPATYANYLVMNRTVLFPTYAQPDNDAAAAKALQRAYPAHDIVGVDCRALICQHGSLHCATMQFPRGVLPEADTL
ncbi:MAG: agmatine deiminase family protein [Alloprevotella sp.]